MRPSEESTFAAVAALAKLWMSGNKKGKEISAVESRKLISKNEKVAARGDFTRYPLKL